MAKGGYRVFDSDLHILEPADLWQRSIDRAYADRAPVGLAESPWDLRVRVLGETFPRLWPTDPAIAQKDQQALARRYGEEIDAGFDVPSQLRAMGKEGIDASVLFPSRALWANAIDGMDPKLSAAISRAYNNWLRDFIRAAQHRALFGAAMLPIHDVGEAVTEVRRAIRDLGFKAAFLRPNIYNGRPWHDRAYDPFWAACQELDIPVCFHEAIGTALPEVGIDRFRTFAMLHTVAHPMEQMMACVSVVMGGVLERFPRLRMAFLEANCGWAPFLAERMDGRYAWRGPVGECPEITREPSEYFKRQCWVSVECDEKTVGSVIEHLGDDRLVTSTDYPHSDARYPHAIETFLKLPLSGRSKRKILWDNTAALYRVSPR